MHQVGFNYTDIKYSNSNYVTMGLTRLWNDSLKEKPFTALNNYKCVCGSTWQKIGIFSNISWKFSNISWKSFIRNEKETLSNVWGVGSMSQTEGQTKKCDLHESLRLVKTALVIYRNTTLFLITQHDIPEYRNRVYTDLRTSCPARLLPPLKTLRTASFKLFKRPLPGFFTILTL